MSFLDDYLHAAGDSEVPQDFHVWCGIGLIAASVGDRVWYEKFPGKKLAPNLYIGLVGPSAIGKGEAMDTALRLATQHPRINVYNGRATPQFLFEFMSKTHQGEDGLQYDSNKVWVTHEELSSSIDKGDTADRFVKFMTEHYSSRPYVKTDGTITRSLKKVHDPCFNWTFGSNLRWMLDVFPDDAISGGTWGRIIGVQCEYDLTKRIRKPRVPADTPAVVDRMHQRLDELTYLEGPFKLSAKADRMVEEWYTNRPAPTDESLIPAWRRQDDMIHKLAMVLALSDGSDLMIRSEHVTRALDLSASVMRRLAEIQASAAATPDTRGIVFVKQYLRAARRPVLHTELMRRFYAKGFGDSEQMKKAIFTLIDGGEAHVKRNGTGTLYTWTGRRRMPKDDGPMPEAEGPRTSPEPS